MVGRTEAEVMWARVYAPYSFKWAERNMWRTDTYFRGEFAEAMREAEETYWKCVPRWDPSRAPASRMAYFKRALDNRWIALAKLDTAMRGQKPEPASDTNRPRFILVDDAAEELVKIPTGPPSDDELLTWLEQKAPPEVREFMRLLRNAPDEFSEALFAGNRDAVRRRIASFCKGIDVLGLAERVLESLPEHVQVPARHK